MPDNNTLIMQMREGDEYALEALITQNTGLVRSIALRFCGRGTDYEDLIQIGTIGLMRAARSFDFSFGCMFSTYAVPLIIGEIRRFLRDDGLIKVSRTVKAAGVNILRKKEDYIGEHGRDPTISELSSLCGITCEEVVTALEATAPISSLCDKVGNDDTTLEFFIADKENTDERITDRIALSDAISKLTPCQRQIVTLRFYKDMSQQQTGKILGMTQVKISREEKKILEALRKSL